MNKELLIVISGPSGAGKGTVVNEIIKDKDYALSISATTRAPREGEKEGISYFFKSVDEFKSLISNNKLLEYAQFCGNYYGTPSDYVDSKMTEGKNVILEIEVQGALQVKRNVPDAVLIFMMPPSIKELRKRLEERGTEAWEVIEQRLKRAEEEIEYINKYDYVVINDTVDRAAEDIKKIALAEKLKTKRNTDKIINFKGAK